MRGRTPRLEATQSTILTPSREACDACGQLLWVGYHTHRTVTKLDGRWRVNHCGSSLCAGRRVPATMSLIVPKKREAGHCPTENLAVAGDCPDWSVAFSRAPQCSRDASCSPSSWSEDHRTQCDAFDAAL